MYYLLRGEQLSSTRIDIHYLEFVSRWTPEMKPWLNVRRILEPGSLASREGGDMDL